MYDKPLLNHIVKEGRLDVPSTSSRQAAYEVFEKLDYPVWKRLREKDTSVPDYHPYNNQKILFHQQQGVNITPNPTQTEAIADLVSKNHYGPSDKHRTLTETFTNAGTLIQIEEQVVVEEPIILQLAMNKENPLLLDRHTVKVGESASVTIVLDYSDDGSEVYHSGLLNIIAEKNAKVHVVKIQNLSQESTHIYGGLSLLERDAHVRFNSIDLGAKLTVTDYSTYLHEENANSVVDSIYLGEGQSKLDLGYNIYHNGRRTESDITVKGALLDATRKVFRGNLYFAKGAVKSQGAEQEYVILLDERVKADSIPALLCDEDDVQGEHAASAGQVDSNKLFYLMSRGLTEKEAKQLIIMASFAPVIEQLPIEGLKERIHKTVGEKLTQDL